MRRSEEEQQRKREKREGGRRRERKFIKLVVPDRFFLFQPSSEQIEERWSFHPRNHTVFLRQQPILNTTPPRVIPLLPTPNGRVHR